MPRRRERIDIPPPLLDYHQSVQDPRIVQLAAEQSVIPGAEHREAGKLGGRPPQSIKTSLLPARSDFTDDGSLAGLTNATSSGAPESVSSSQGRRWTVQNARLLVHDSSGALTPTHLPPFGDPPVLQCPFNFLHCTRHYTMGNMNDWFNHSLSHFTRTGATSSRSTAPPTSSDCCFCEMTFRNMNGLACWNDRMRHVAWHHHSGHSLSHARPDFGLFRYLWEEHIIGDIEYRELGNLRQIPPRSPQNIPTPPDSPIDTRQRVVAELNERRSRNA